MRFVQRLCQDPSRVTTCSPPFALRLCLLTLFFFHGSSAGLVTAYVTFDTPDGWKCELSQGVWICQTTVETHRKDAVVLSIASLATDWDTLDNYEQYLKEARTIKDEQGGTLTSKITYVRRRKLNQTEWIDSLQFNSELPGFWARYLVTTHTTGQTRLAILITYIVSEDKYSYFAPQFERMISSLKPNAEFDLNIATQQGEGPLPGSDRLGPVPKILAERLQLKKRETADGATNKKGETDSSGFWVIVFIVAAGAYLWWRRRKSQAIPPVPREPTLPR